MELAQNYEEFIRLFAAIKILCKKYNINLDVELTGDPSSDIKYIYDVTENLNEEITAEKNKYISTTLFNKHLEEFDSASDDQFTYHFSDHDFARIQELISKLRDLTVTSKLFKPDHKRRFLIRLEQLQSELHQRSSRIDILFGFFGEAGVTLGRFGKDAMPFAVLIKEMFHITRNTQARAESLPEGTPIPSLEAGECGDEVEETEEPS